MDKVFQELIDSFTNGNRSYAMAEIKKFRKKKLIQFFFYLHVNEDWLDKKVNSDLIHAIHSKAIT